MEYLGRHSNENWVVCLQEPYLNPRGMCRLHKSFEAHWRVNGLEKARAAVITSKRLEGYLVTQHSGKDCAVVRIMRGSVGVISLYCDIRGSIHESWVMPKLECSVSRKVIICADANSSHSAWGGGGGHKRGRERGKEYVKMLEELNLHICNKAEEGPTFTGPGDRRTFIDLTQCTATCIGKVRSWSIMAHDFGSDHRAIRFTYGGLEADGTMQIVEPSRTPWKRPTKGAKVMMERELPKMVTYHRRIRTEEDLQAYWSGHANNIKEALLRLFPTKKNKSTQVCYWWTKAVDRAHKEYQMARRRMRIMRKQRGFAGEEEMAEVRITRGRWRREIKIAKLESWKKFTSQISDPWNGIHRILRMTDRGRGRAATLCDVNGHFGSTMFSTLRLLAKQFFPSPPDPTAEHIAMEAEVSRRLLYDEQGPEISILEYDEALKAMAGYSAPGEDGITCNVVRLLSAVGWGARYREVFNASLRLAYVPREWKKAKIVLIPKSGAISVSTKSMRPISLTPVHGKLMERIVNQRLLHELETTGKLASAQHAYRRGGSTVTALYEAVTFIESAMERKMVCQAVFLDISGAFDRAWHTGILAEMLNLGVSKYLVKWIRHYLADRKAIFGAGGEKLEVTLEQGCPQGGVLSPLLWNILFNRFLLIEETGVPSGVPPISIIGYADDALVLCQARTASSATARIQRVISKIEAWAEKYRVVFNPTKMHTMIFDRRSKDRPAGMSSGLKFGGSSIMIAEQCRYLGVTLDNKLKWKAQVDNCLDKLGTVTRMLRGAVREAWGLTQQILKLLYAAIFRPVMTYAIPIWMAGVQTKAAQAKFERVIRDYAVMATRTFRTAPTCVILQLMGIRPFREVLEEETMRTAVLQLQLCMRGARGSAARARSSYDTRTTRLMKQSLGMLNPLANEIKHVDLMHYYADHPVDWYQADCVHEDRVKALWECVDTSGWILYTDASSTSYGRGWAVALYRHGFLRRLEYGSLQEVSVFTTELYAIWQAVKMVRELSCGRKEIIEVRTDALSCIMALQRTIQVDPNLRHCWLELRKRKAEGYNLRLRWIPGHEGVEGNKQADAAAKLGVGSACRPESPHVTSRDVKRMMREKMERLAMARFNKVEQKIFKGFIPNRMALQRLWSTSRSSSLYQLLSGHCRVNHYLHKIGAVASAECKCGAMDETVEHHMCDCDEFNEVREDVWSRNVLRWEEVTQGTWEQIEKFIVGTGRLRRAEVE